VVNQIKLPTNIIAMPSTTSAQLRTMSGRTMWERCMIAPMDITNVMHSNIPRISPQVSCDGVKVRLTNTSSLPCSMMLIATDNPPKASKAKSKNAQTPISRFETIDVKGGVQSSCGALRILFLAELSSRGDSLKESVLKGATERKKNEKRKEERETSKN